MASTHSRLVRQPRKLSFFLFFLIRFLVWRDFHVFMKHDLKDNWLCLTWENATRAKTFIQIHFSLASKRVLVTCWFSLESWCVRRWQKFKLSSCWCLSLLYFHFQYHESFSRSRRSTNNSSWCHFVFTFNVLSLTIALKSVEFIKQHIDTWSKLIHSNVGLQSQ